MRPALTILYISALATLSAATATTLGCKKSEPERHLHEQSGPHRSSVDEPQTPAPTARPNRRRDLVGPTTAIGQRPILDKFDSDGDGRLDDAERAEYEKTRIETVLKLVDTNGDQTISPAEAKHAGPRLDRVFDRFDELDSDGSGALDRTELAQALARPIRLHAKPSTPSAQGAKK